MYIKIKRKVQEELLKIFIERKNKQASRFSCCSKQIMQRLLDIDVDRLRTN